MDEGDLGGWGQTLETLSSPCFWIATVTVASRLARNEEADTVVVVVAFTGAPTTQDTALIERTVSRRMSCQTHHAPDVQGNALASDSEAALAL